LDEFYRSYYGDNQGSDGVAFHDPNRFAKHLSKWVHIESLKPKGDILRICDFGGGDGSLARAIATQLGVDCSIDVVDYSSNEIQSTDSIDIRYFSSIDATSGRYNLILASAVLEHMVDPLAILRKLFFAIEPNGFFYARTPFVLPFLRFIPSFDFLFPAHLHDFGPAFWNRAIRTFGWCANLVSSRPSIVETSLRNSPFRTSVANAIKFPALLQQAFQRSPDTVPLWPFVGGWEVVIQTTD
ncbi:class I SAM-dependent methyltransferase, partial [archaeon]|nr:class I SAM-dependent methyltransferase [archaeon]